MTEFGPCLLFLVGPLCLSSSINSDWLPHLSHNDSSWPWQHSAILAQYIVWAAYLLMTDILALMQYLVYLLAVCKYLHIPAQTAAHLLIIVKTF